MLLYIHIPFCDSKCNYCSFNSYTHLHHFKENYVQSLLIQLSNELQKYQPIIETIFIGGGTPSTLESNYYKQILQVINPYKKSDKIEITIEANPNSATYQWLEDMYALGINRISFGVQSFDDKKLEFLNRSHNKSQAINAIQNAKKIGFEHINCDIIYDTKLDTKELLEYDLNIIQTLPIDHISAYSLTIEENTKFYNTPSVHVENIELAQYFFDTLKSLGFCQYEISNFAKNQEARSKHNLGYWEYKQYIGIGSGAVGRIQDKRYTVQKDVLQYIQDPFDYEYETLSQDDQLIEKILLGLRSCIGFDYDILTKKQKEKLKILEDEAKVIIDDNQRKVFSKDYLIADEIALFILD